MSADVLGISELTTKSMYIKELHKMLQHCWISGDNYLWKFLMSIFSMFNFVILGTFTDILLNTVETL